MKKIISIFLLVVICICHLNLMDAVMQVTHQYAKEKSKQLKDIEDEKKSEKEESKGKEKTNNDDDDYLCHHNNLQIIYTKFPPKKKYQLYNASFANQFFLIKELKPPCC